MLSFQCTGPYSVGGQPEKCDMVTLTNGDYNGEYSSMSGKS